MTVPIFRPTLFLGNWLVTGFSERTWGWVPDTASGMSGLNTPHSYCEVTVSRGIRAEEL